MIRYFIRIDYTISKNAIGFYFIFSLFFLSDSCDACVCVCKGNDLRIIISRGLQMDINFTDWNRRKSLKHHMPYRIQFNQIKYVTEESEIYIDDDDDDDEEDLPRFHLRLVFVFFIQLTTVIRAKKEQPHDFCTIRKIHWCR